MVPYSNQILLCSSSVAFHDTIYAQDKSICWDEGEHVTFRSTTSTSHCADEDRAHKSCRIGQGRGLDGGPFDPLRSDDDKTKPP